MTPTSKVTRTVAPSLHLDAANANPGGAPSASMALGALVTVIARAYVRDHHANRAGA